MIFILYRATQIVAYKTFFFNFHTLFMYQIQTMCRHVYKTLEAVTHFVY